MIKTSHGQVGMLNGLVFPVHCEQCLADIFLMLLMPCETIPAELTRSRGRSRNLSLLLIAGCCVCCPCGANLSSCTVLLLLRCLRPLAAHGA